MAQQFEDPPELLDSTGEPIVQFRRPDGSFFSNHPEYDFAKAMYAQRASQVASQPAVDIGDQLIEDEAVEPDDGDGKISYEEMTTAALGAEVLRRELDMPKPARRSTLIQVLQDDDAAQVAAGGS